MEMGLRKAWVEEIRKKYARKRVRVVSRWGEERKGEFREIFLTSSGGYGKDDEIRISILLDGHRDYDTTQYRVQCTGGYNDNELRWRDYGGSNAFVAKTVDNGDIVIELQFNDEAYASGGPAPKSNRKGLAPGLKLVSLRGRKGVAPALLK